MNREIELLAPGGDIDAIKVAIIAGANAIYCGLERFNARNRAENISFEELNCILYLAHKNDCKIFITLNILILESEIPSLFILLNKLSNTTIDGVIVQDLGMLYLLNCHFNTLKIHASTQLTTHNAGQIGFLKELKVERINLSRELNHYEVKKLSEYAHKNDMQSEVFVHGSHCISFSGQCYMSSVHGGNSGNRGRCSQPCRNQYKPSPLGNIYPLNLKDNSLYTDVKTLVEAGVDSFKIEGRIKKSPYVYAIVRAWKDQLKNYQQGEVNKDNRILYNAFNRDFSNSYFSGNLHKNMFIDNPRDHSAIYLSKARGGTNIENIEKAKAIIFNERKEYAQYVQDKVNRFNVEKIPVQIYISGALGKHLSLGITTNGKNFSLFSKTVLERRDSEPLNIDIFFKRFKIINESAFFIERIDLSDLEDGLFISFKELTSLKKKLWFVLHNKEYKEPVKLPGLNRGSPTVALPTLSVLISTPNDLDFYEQGSAMVYYQIPNGVQDSFDELKRIFLKYKDLIPYFPSILIEKNYLAALRFIDDIKPKLLVSNNTGIAFYAYKKGIKWIAGPQMNLVNSYSLINLRENFNCSGAYLSNELNNQQIKAIQKPTNFKLYFNLLNPCVLMTSRLCLFQQIKSCGKEQMDDNCLRQCENSARITNLKNTSFVIHKSKGNYTSIYNNCYYLNTEIYADVPCTFDGFCIDLRGIKTNTNFQIDNTKLITMFENYLTGDPNVAEKIKSAIYPTTQSSYVKGI